MATKFVNVDRNTPMLLPPDLRDWVGEDDLVHFVIEAVKRLPLEVFQVNHRGSSDQQQAPSSCGTYTPSSLTSRLICRRW